VLDPDGHDIEVVNPQPRLSRRRRLPTGRAIRRPPRAGGTSRACSRRPRRPGRRRVSSR
jgi:hypothetical protein